MMTGHIIGNQFDGPLEFLLGSLPVVIVVLNYQSERGVGFRKFVVELYSADCGCAGARRSICRGYPRYMPTKA